MTEQPTTTTTPPALPAPASAEQAADLAALEAAAGVGADGQPQAQPAQNLPAPYDQTEDVFNVLQMVRDMAAPALDDMGVVPAARIEAIWDDKALKKVAAPLSQLMQRHGITLHEAMDQFGPYIMLIVGLWGPSMATWRAMQLHAQELAAAAKRKPDENS